MASISVTRSVLSSTASAARKTFPSKNQQQLSVSANCLGIGIRSQKTIRRSSFIRCMADKADGKKVTSATPAGTNIPATPTPAAPSKPKVSTKFTDVLAFNGPAPERINGRLAMVGFVAAIAVELSSGQSLVSQINGAGLPWFVYTSVLLSAASLVPLFSGSRAEAVNKGLMNANAELWNGRFAMLGLVALAITEYVKGTTLV